MFKEMAALRRATRRGPWYYRDLTVVVEDFDGFTPLLAVPVAKITVEVMVHNVHDATIDKKWARKIGNTIGSFRLHDEPLLQSGKMKLVVDLNLRRGILMDV